MQCSICHLRAPGPSVPFCSSWLRLLGMQAPQVQGCSAVGATRVTHVVVQWVAPTREGLVSSWQVENCRCESCMNEHKWGFVALVRC